jgi:hypothetical protein
VELSDSAAEQRTYARWLRWGTRAGLALTLAAFVAYGFGLLAPFVALDRLPALWGMPVDRYLALSGAATGWDWLRLAGHADYLNLLGIALLALVTIGAYARVGVLYWRRGERLQAALASAQVLVLLIAASGLLAGGH